MAENGLNHHQEAWKKYLNTLTPGISRMSITVYHLLHFQTQVKPSQRSQVNHLVHSQDSGSCCFAIRRRRVIVQLRRLSRLYSHTPKTSEPFPTAKISNSLGNPLISPRTRAILTKLPQDLETFDPVVDLYA